MIIANIQTKSSTVSISADIRKEESHNIVNSSYGYQFGKGEMMYFVLIGHESEQVEYLVMAPYPLTALCIATRQFHAKEITKTEYESYIELGVAKDIEEIYKPNNRIYSKEKKE
jgi:hypothetical protein